MSDAYLIYLMAGKGDRINNELPKQFIKIHNRDLFLYALDTLYKTKNFKKIIIVTLIEYIDYVESVLSNLYKNNNFLIINGASTREGSVFNALNFLNNNFKINENDKIMIHDACRPLINPSIINEILNYEDKYLASTVYTKSVNSLALIDKNSFLNKYIDREKVINIETPQCINFSLLYNSHLKAIESKKIYTDDISILEIDLKKVKLIKGNFFNFKVTNFEDLLVFEKLTKL